jgi:hypothetical protein
MGIEVQVTVTGLSPAYNRGNENYKTGNRHYDVKPAPEFLVAKHVI